MPGHAPGLRFTRRFAQSMWDKLHSEVGAGWYRDRFLYLFGENLEEFRPCVDAWSFLMPGPSMPKH